MLDWIIDIIVGFFQLVFVNYPQLAVITIVLCALGCWILLAASGTIIFR